MHESADYSKNNSSPPAHTLYTRMQFIVIVYQRSNAVRPVTIIYQTEERTQSLVFDSICQLS